jgi:transposase
MEIRLLSDHRHNHITEITRLTNRLRWNLVILDPGLEASIRARKMDFPCHSNRIARRLRGMEASTRVLIAKEQVRAIRELSRRATLLKRELHGLIAAYRPELLAEVGWGTITAAILIGQTAGAERFTTDAQFARRPGVAPIPASSGKRDRHRLHRGGNRRMNHALHIIAITRARRDLATEAYLQRKEAEGKTRMEALRCLKRHLARRFHRILLRPPASPAVRAAVT